MQATEPRTAESLQQQGHQKCWRPSYRRYINSSRGGGKSRDFSHTKDSTYKQKKTAGPTAAQERDGTSGDDNNSRIAKNGGNWNLNNSTDASNSKYSSNSRDARNIGIWDHKKDVNRSIGKAAIAEILEKLDWILEKLWNN
jgi:hypothetical protein